MPFEKYQGYLDAINLRHPSAEVDIDSIESRFMTRLPDIYRDFLLHTNGYEGPLGREGYLVLYSTEEVESLTESFRQHCPVADIIIVGGDGGGEYLCIIPSRSGDNVFNYPAIGASPNEQPAFVAPSVGEVIVMASEGQLTLPPFPVQYDREFP